MFNKFELLGISASIMSMAVALYLVNIQTATLMAPKGNTNSTQGAVVIVGNDANQQAALKNALLDSATDDGTLHKLIVDDVLVGTGDAVALGNTVTVHYIGTLQNGQEFDNSNKRGEPFTFTVGEGKVIKGWEEGIVGMKVGGKRILVVPASMGYGEKGFGPIPGGASLVFAIELLNIK